MDHQSLEMLKCPAESASVQEPELVDTVMLRPATWMSRQCSPSVTVRMDMEETGNIIVS